MFKPMLADRHSAHTYVDKLRFPLYVSDKLDGLRCVVMNGKALTRSLKPVPNKFIYNLLSNPLLNGLDGEIIVGSPTAENCFHITQSNVMCKGTVPVNFTFFVFDWFGQPGLDFCARLDMYNNLANEASLEFDKRGITQITVVPHIQRLCSTWEKIKAYEDYILTAGYEGLILRSPEGRYKFGRATANEQYMLKLKRFIDDEAEIVGFEELMHNNNEAFKDELGATKRSTHKAGKEGGDTLGAFIVKNDMGTFKVGMFNGLTAGDKKAIWDRQNEYLGRIIKFSYFPVGVKELPRHPKFEGFRDIEDLS